MLLPFTYHSRCKSVTCSPGKPPFGSSRLPWFGVVRFALWHLLPSSSSMCWGSLMAPVVGKVLRSQQLCSLTFGWNTAQRSNGAVVTLWVVYSISTSSQTTSRTYLSCIVASSDFVTEKSRRLLYEKLNCSCWEQVSPFDIVESVKMRILQ